MKSCEQNAKTQVLERSLSEPRFQGDLDYIDSETKDSFNNAIDSITDDSPLAADIIRLGIESLRYKVVTYLEYEITPQDVTNIYRLDDYDGKLATLSKRLHEYLDGRTVALIRFRSIYGDYLMQHWKIYVRHFLILNRIEQFPLINLIHVCEDEFSYVDKLFNKQ
jgi:hypothetical protein